MRELTDLEARTIRWMTTAYGMVDPPDAAMSATIHSLITTEFVTMKVTAEGRQALAEYDQAKAGADSDRETIRQLEEELGVKGTSAVFREALRRAKVAAKEARLALAEQEGKP